TLLPDGTPASFFETPSDRTVWPGETATFTSDTGGQRPLYWQWQLYNTNLTGATQENLTLPQVTRAQAGPYRLVVSNVLNTTSAVAILTIRDLSLVPEGLTSNGFQLRLLADPAFNYRLLGSTNLKQWTDLGGFNNQSGTLRFTDVSATNMARRYYRAL